MAALSRSTEELKRAELVEIIVETEAEAGVSGINVAGGGKEGIFIKDLLKDSPAAKSLSLQEGDQLLSARVFFENFKYEDALRLLQCAEPYKVSFCLKRTVPTGDLALRPGTVAGYEVKGPRAKVAKLNIQSLSPVKKKKKKGAAVAVTPAKAPGSPADLPPVDVEFSFPKFSRLRRAKAEAPAGPAPAPSLRRRLRLPRLRVREAATPAQASRFAKPFTRERKAKAEPAGPEAGARLAPPQVELVVPRPAGAVEGGVGLPGVLLEVAAPQVDLDLRLPKGAEGEVPPSAEGGFALRLPSLGLTSPAEVAPEPAAGALSVRVPQVELPSLPCLGEAPQVAGPTVGMAVPALDVTAPTVTVDLALPGAKVEAPAEAPDVSLKMPRLSFPRFGTRAREGEGPEGSPEGRARGLRLKMPSFGLSRPEPRPAVPEPGAEGKLKLPAVKVPSVSITVPAATVELPKGPEVRLPEVQLPKMFDVKMPEMKLPKMPDMKIPDMKMPKMPEMKMPDMKMPEVPDVKLPEVQLPKMPDMKMPDMKMPEVPEVKLPEVQLPKMPDMKMPDMKMPEVPDIKLPGVQLPKMPDVKMPEVPSVRMPEVQLPKVPDMKMPDMKLPKVPDMKMPEVPEVKLPEVQLPKMPDLKIPDMKMPKMPDMKMPKMPDMKMPEVPEVKLPEVQLPKMPDMKLPEVPAVRLPEVQLPKMPDMKLPEVPAVRLPEVQLPKMPDVHLPKPPAAKLPDVPPPKEGAEGVAWSFKLPKLGRAGSPPRGEAGRPDLQVAGLPGVLPCLEGGESAPQARPGLSVGTLPVVELELPCGRKSEGAVGAEARSQALGWGEVLGRAGQLELDVPTPKLQAEAGLQVPALEVPAVPLPSVELPAPQLAKAPAKQSSVEIKLRSPKFSLAKLGLSGAKAKGEGEAEGPGRGAKLKMPKFGLSFPRVRGAPEAGVAEGQGAGEAPLLPALEVSAPRGSLGVQLPAASASPPEVQPKGQRPAPGGKEAEAAAEEAEGKARGWDGRVKMPKLKMPSFGVGRGSPEERATAVGGPGAQPRTGTGLPALEIAVPGLEAEPGRGPEGERKAPGAPGRGLALPQVELSGLGAGEAAARPEGHPGHGTALRVQLPQVDLAVPGGAGEPRPGEAVAPPRVQLDGEAKAGPAEGKFRLKMPAFRSGGEAEGTDTQPLCPAEPGFHLALPAVGFSAGPGASPGEEGKQPFWMPAVELCPPTVGSQAEDRLAGPEGEAARRSRLKLPRFGLALGKGEGDEAGKARGPGGEGDGRRGRVRLPRVALSAPPRGPAAGPPPGPRVPRFRSPFSGRRAEDGEGDGGSPRFHFPKVSLGPKGHPGGGQAGRDGDGAAGFKGRLPQVGFSEVAAGEPPGAEGGGREAGGV
ncbi:periaxin [Tachyglossus aculeatus]|uniref:periaxin n=1 Tax=Tachyglossus aculeatus TaxID=9261 RepID=UPI0018F754F1|nr:periaxin [Tachyglossus aculeatus]